MAVITETLTVIWSKAGSSLSGSSTKSGDSELSQRIACVGSGTNSGNTVVDVTVPGAALQMLFLQSDKPLALTFTVAGDPVVINVGPAGYTWISELGDNPLDGAITALSVHNVSASAANLSIEMLYDGTP